MPCYQPFPTVVRANLTDAVTHHSWYILFVLRVNVKIPRVTRSASAPVSASRSAYSADDSATIPFEGTTSQYTRRQSPKQRRSRDHYGDVVDRNKGDRRDRQPRRENNNGPVREMIVDSVVGARNRRDQQRRDDQTERKDNIKLVPYTPRESVSRGVAHDDHADSARKRRDRQRRDDKTERRDDADSARKRWDQKRRDDETERKDSMKLVVSATG